MSYEYEKVATPADGLRLHLNENTAGCSPAVLEALRGITGEAVASYPDYSAPIASCCEHLGIPPDHLLLTNGLDEGILAASVASLRGSPGAHLLNGGAPCTPPGALPSAGSSPPAPFRALRPEAIVVVPAFDMYAACADAAGGRVVEVLHGPQFEFPRDPVLRAITPATRIVFITSPNNPTGITVPRESILAIAAAAPGALIFVDEAYADFSGITLIGTPALDQFPNIVVGRTFAKAYGLAGIRAGALIGKPRTLAPIRRVVPPYSLNVAATVAIPAALRDRDRYDWYLAEVRESKRLLYEALGRLGVPYWVSDTNFVLARFGADSGRVLDGLRQRGIHLRDRSNDHGCGGCIRITTGIVAHTRRCIEAIDEVLCAAR